MSSVEDLNVMMEELKRVLGEQKVKYENVWNELTMPRNRGEPNDQAGGG